MPSSRRVGGRRWRRLVAYVLERDHGICWICGHPGADTGDHVIPLDAGGEEFDAGNVRAAHGAARIVYGCPGQFGRTPRSPVQPGALTAELASVVRDLERAGVPRGSGRRVATRALVVASLPVPSDPVLDRALAHYRSGAEGRSLGGGRVW